MSLANIQGKLSRAEMKNIMAGSGDGDVDSHCNAHLGCGSGPCTLKSGRTGYCYSNEESGNGKCYCVTAY